MLGNLLYLLAALLLVLLNGFFVAAEFALVKLRHTQATGLAARHGWRGRVLLNVHEHLDAYLSACQLGITLASLGLGWIGEPAFAGLLEPLFARFEVGPDTAHIIAFVIAFTVISYLHIVLGELAPKSMAIRRPERMSLWTAAPLYAFYWLMYPAIWLLNASANRILNSAGLGVAHSEEQQYSSDELKLILHAKRAARSGRPVGEEFVMMSHALELPELVAGDLMRTRDQLAYLHQGMTLEEVLASFRTARYSRYPWFDEEEETVLGILHVKDLLQAVTENGGQVQDIASLLRPAVTVPLEAPVLDILKRFRSGHTHIALCAEESGRIVGFFTMEDVIEVIVGDIEDEHRRAGPGAVQKASDGSFSISGGLPIFRLERMLERDIPAPVHINSVGGLIIDRLERLPTEGEMLSFDDFDLIVRKMQGARIKTITVQPKTAMENAP